MSSTSEALKPIIIYDCPSKNPAANGYSANTWKTRYSLNYKGLAHKTIWVKYHEIESTLKAAGIPPTSVKLDGAPRYTIPAIVDPNTGATVAESLQIAEYLDKTYPDKPSIIPAGTKALQSAFIDATFANISPAIPFFLYEVFQNLIHPESHEYYRKVWENGILGGVSIEDAHPKGERAKEEWAKFEAGFGKMAKWMKEGDEFVMGDVISFSDFVLGGYLQLAFRIWGQDSREWKDISSWDGGRWGRLHDSLKRYSAVF